MKFRNSNYQRQLTSWRLLAFTCTPVHIDLNLRVANARLPLHLALVAVNVAVRAAHFHHQRRAALATHTPAVEALRTQRAIFVASFCGANRKEETRSGFEVERMPKNEEALRDRERPMSVTYNAAYSTPAPRQFDRSLNSLRKWRRFNLNAKVVSTLANCGCDVSECVSVSTAEVNLKTSTVRWKPKLMRGCNPKSQ